MTTFYDNGTARITENWVSIRGFRYPIDRLDNLRTARGPTDQTARRAARCAAVALAALLAVGPYLPVPGTLLLVMVLVGGPAALALLRVRSRPAAYLLLADHQGEPVQLYQTTDAIEFGKISRALLRATRVRCAVHPLSRTRRPSEPPDVFGSRRPVPG